MFRKNLRHLITFDSGGHSTQIDYHLSRGIMRNRIKDCKVILGEPLAKQHRLLLIEYFMRKRVNDPPPEPISKIKWFNLNTDKGLEFTYTMKEYIGDILVLDRDEPQTPQQLWTFLHEPCVELAGNTAPGNTWYAQMQKLSQQQQQPARVLRNRTANPSRQVR